MSSKKLVKNTGMLYAFNISKMIFPLITLPYLTRILSVEVFGVVAFVKAVMQYMQIFVDFGFMLSGTKDVALVCNDNKKVGCEAGNVLAARCIICVIALLVLLVMCCYMTILSDFKLYTYASFFVVFLSCFFMDYLFRGLEIMEFITIRFIAMKTIGVLFTFVFIKSDSDIIWIPLLEIIGSIVAVALVWIQIHKLNISIRISSLKDIIAKIKVSSVYFISEVSTTVFGSLITVLVGIYLPEKQISYWSVCQQLIIGAKSLYTPVTSSIYPEMVKNKDVRIIKKVITIFAPLITLGCIFTYFVADIAVVIIAGANYLPAGEVLRYFIPFLFISFFAMLYGWPVLGAIGNAKTVTFTTICAAAFQVCGLIALIITGYFNLINIAILRGFAELVLFAVRYGLYYKLKIKKCCNII